MDAARFSELYATEAREHVVLLNRSLLELESSAGSRDAVGEAFRAAHTLKGIAAAMGHAAVGELAHRIEDELEPFRSGGIRPDPARIDALLAAVDALEEAIEASLRPPVPRVDRLRITLSPDTPLKAARATLIVMKCRREGLIGRSEPEEFPDAFDDPFLVELAPGSDAEAVADAIRACGDVQDVAPADAAPVASSDSASPKRQVRVDATRLDALAEGLGELTVLHSRAWAAQSGDRSGSPSDRVAMLLGALQDEVLRLRMRPIATVTDRLPRVVRDAARAAGRSVRLVVEGSDIELDRAILDELFDPLLHLVRNAVDHGIEPPGERERVGKPTQGVIRVTSERERTSVRIRVSDDGRGIDRDAVAVKGEALGLRAAGDRLTDDEALRILVQPGLSTAERITDLSGRGVGMDVVAGRIRALGGALTLRSEEGRGATFTLRLPLTLALAHALRVRVGAEDYAIPLTHVSEAVELQGVLVSAIAGRETLRVRDELLPLIRLRGVLGIVATGSEQAAVVAEIGERRAALAVDELVGREQILITGFDPPAGALPIFSGATIMAGGRPALVLDPISVV